MKILHIITGLGRGGAETVLMRLVLESSSFKHYVVSLKTPGPIGQSLKNAGIDVFTCEADNIFLSYRILRLFPIIIKLRPRIVQTWMYHADLIGGIVSKFCFVKDVFWNIRHSNFSSCELNLKRRIFLSINGFLSHLIPKKIITCSKAAIEEHSRYGYKVDAMIYIPNGVDVSGHPVDKIPLHVKPNHVPTFVMLARYHPQKDFKNLLASLAIVRNSGYEFKILLAGKNVDFSNNELVHILDKLELRNYVSLYGLVHHPLELIKKSDFLLLSSSNGEGFPNVLIEAMSLSVPCIATDVGDSKWVIGDTGLVVEPKSPNALSAAIIYAIDILGTQQYFNFSDSARARVLTKFSLSTMVLNYETTWSCDNEALHKHYENSSMD